MAWPVVANAQVEVPTSTKPIPAAKPSEPHNFSLSALVPRDRELEVKAQAIDKLIAKKKHSAAVEILIEILSSREEGLIPFQGSLQRPRSLARQRILKLSPIGLNAYRRNVEKRAQEHLESVLKFGDESLLQEVVTLYPMTKAAERAREFWVAAVRDRGDQFRSALILQELAGSANSGQYKNRLAAQLDRLKAEGSALKTAAPKKTLFDDFRPSVVPVWSMDHDLSGGAIKAIMQGHRDLREHGLTPFSPWGALFVGDQLLTVTPNRIEAKNRETGELLWSRPLEQYGARILTKLNDVASPLRSWNIARAVLFRVFGESTYAQLASDGESLYFTEATESGSKFEQRRKDRRAANRVVCLDLKTGEEKWSNSTIAKSRAYLCGPPTVLDDELLVMAEYRHTSQIYLLALDKATGKIKRQLSIAEPSKPVEAGTFDERDGRRQGVACPIRIVGARAYCPTSAGVLAAVNLVHWKIDWIYRYPRHDVPLSGTGMGRPELGLTGFQWWSGWNGIQMEFFDDSMAFVSPESNLLSLHNRFSGELLWRVDREDGLYVAHASREYGVVVIGANSARAYSTIGGEVTWQTSLNFPMGRGVQIGGFYLLPDSEFGWTVIDLKTGKRQDSRFNSDSNYVPVTITNLRTPRNFISNNGELYELSYRGVKRLQSLDGTHDVTETESIALKILSAIELGNIDAAMTYFLDSQSASSEKDEHIAVAGIALVQELEKKHFSKTKPEVPFEGFAEHGKFLFDSSLIQSWFRVAFDHALKSKNWKMLKNVLSSQLTRPIAQGFGTSRKRRFRIDRWIATRLVEADRLFSSEEKERLAKTIEEIWQARGLDNPDEREFLQQMFAFTPWSRKTSEVDSENPEQLEEKVSRQLNLLQKESRQSIFLAPVEFEKQNRNWLTETPVVTQKARGSSSIYFEPVPIENVDGTPNCQINVQIEYPGHRAVRFSGKNWNRPWDAYLPRTNRVLRMERELARGWMLGRLLVLQVGSEVYGISPLNAEGHRGARLLWPSKGQAIDTLGDRSNQMLSFQSRVIPERVGFPQQPAKRMSEFGHYATEVGPVRASYFCIQQKGMLVAFETFTGKEIWRRYDLPQAAICLGDEEKVVVIDQKQNVAQILSALAGHELNRRPFSFSMDSILIAVGVHALVMQGGSDNRPLILEWVNFSNGESIWKREWKAGAIPFELDGRRFGVVSSTGGMEIVATDSGETVVTHELDLPEELSKIVCSVGERDYLVIFSKPVEDAKILNATQQSGASRRELVHGPMVSIDRQSGEVLWESKLENAVFPLHQPVDLPVFITAGSRFPEEIMDDQVPGSRIQMFHRQTGERLYKADSLGPVSRYNISGNVETGVVTLVTRTAIVEVDFSSGKPKTDLKEKEESK